MRKLMQVGRFCAGGQQHSVLMCESARSQPLHSPPRPCSASQSRAKDRHPVVGSAKNRLIRCAEHANELAGPSLRFASPSAGYARSALRRHLVQPVASSSQLVQRAISLHHALVRAAQCPATPSQRRRHGWREAASATARPCRERPPCAARVVSRSQRLPYQLPCMRHLLARARHSCTCGVFPSAHRRQPVVHPRPGSEAPGARAIASVLMAAALVPARVRELCIGIRVRYSFWLRAVRAQPLPLHTPLSPVASFAGTLRTSGCCRPRSTVQPGRPAPSPAAPPRPPTQLVTAGAICAGYPCQHAEWHP